jgi:valyl-tRNA synthetase
MIASWPIADSQRQDAEIEARFARFQEVLAGLREIRSRQNIPPKQPMNFSVRCDAETAALLRPMEPYFASMAGAHATAYGADVAAPPSSANFTRPGCEVFVDLAGLIDVGAEIAKHEKEREKLVGFIAAKQKKLFNESFLSRAPADVVEREREGVRELQERLASIDATLVQMRKL